MRVLFILFRNEGAYIRSKRDDDVTAATICSGVWYNHRHHAYAAWRLCVHVTFGRNLVHKRTWSNWRKAKKVADDGDSMWGHPQRIQQNHLMMFWFTEDWVPEDHHVDHHRDDCLYNTYLPSGGLNRLLEFFLRRTLLMFTSQNFFIKSSFHETFHVVSLPVSTSCTTVSYHSLHSFILVLFIFCRYPSPLYNLEPYFVEKVKISE